MIRWVPDDVSVARQVRLLKVGGPRPISVATAETGLVDIARSGNDA